MRVFASLMDRGAVALLLALTAVGIPRTASSQMAPLAPFLCDPEAGCPQTPGAPYDLGALPAELAGLEWPQAPTVTSTHRVTTCAELTAALDVPGARIEMAAGTYPCSITIDRSDQDLVLSAGATLSGDITLSRNLGQARTRIVGGTVNGSINGASINDLLIDNVHVANSTGVYVGYVAGSDRVAILNSTIDSVDYAIFTPATSQNNDLIVANCNLVGGNPSGEQATVRIQQTTRAVLVDNRVWNGGKHTFRVHSASDLVYARDNQFEVTGTMMDNHDPGRIQCDRCWLIGNRWYRLMNSLVQVASYDPSQADGVNVLVMTDNVAYTDSLQEQFPSGWGPSWVVTNNSVFSYRSPPPFTAGADH